MICIDAGPVIDLVAFPGKILTYQLWEQWDYKGIPIIAPALLYYEITNVLHRYHKLGVLSDSTCQTALSSALALPIQLVEDPELHLHAAQIARDCGLAAAYDSHYLALAERYDVELWTTDQRFHNQIKQHGIDRVRLMPVD